MPTIRTRTALGIGGVNANVLTGSQFEFLGVPSRIQVYGIQDLAGGAGVVEIEVFFGQELQLTQTRMNQLATATGPTIPDDLLIDDFGAGGDRLVVRLTETGGAAVGVGITLVKITPIPM